MTVIKNILVENLFFSFNYNIEFPEDQTTLILTGPNGYGKTTILKIIEAASKGNLLYFHFLPFSYIKIVYSDSLCFEIRKEILDKEDANNLSAPDLITETDSHIDESISDSISSFITSFSIHGGNGTSNFEIDDSKIHKAIQMSHPRYRSRYFRGMQLDTFSTIDTKYALKHSEEIISYIFSNDPENSVFQFYMQSLPNVYLVPAQRLHTKANDKTTDARSADDDIWIESIEDVSKKLREQLKTSLSEYHDNSQKIDSLFIDNILYGDEEIDEIEYKAIENQLKDKIDFLRKCNLIGEVKIPKYQKENSKILNYYIRDLSKKLSSFDDLISKLGLFFELIKTKGFTGKEVEVKLGNGLRIRNNMGAFIEIENLSSGEKNELIMLYHYIFGISDGGILLVDEPEISLHVAWQLPFVDELTKIAERKNFKVIIATHSPEIINGKWNSCYDLFREPQIENVANS